MPAPTLAFYISGHGFGHASRDIEVLNTLHRHAPAVRLILRTSAPRWLFDLTATAPFAWHPAECDTGIAQIDSLRLDAAETIRRAAAFYDTLAERADGEKRFLREQNVTLVVGDIPPLAFTAAARAGVPSLALGNFTWDWIYAAYDEAARDAPLLVPTIREAYAHAGRAMRLPIGGGFESFANVDAVPFIARRASHDPDETRARFGLPAKGRLVLASFGGYGLADIDLGAMASLDDWLVVVTSNVRARRRDADPAVSVPAQAPGYDDDESDRLPATVRFIDERDIYAAGYRYEDLVAAVDVVATKPGYGIIAECVANDTAILYTPRGRFIEYDVMVQEMPRYLRCAFISNEDLYAGRWQAPLDALVAQPLPPERPRVDGAEIVARYISQTLGFGR
jgi:hypothetical protein